MAYSYWLSGLGYGTFFISFIVAIILFAVKRRFYPVMYLVSIATYVFTVGFIIAAFNMGREGVLVVLAISAVFFILIGFYLSSKSERMKEESLEKIPSRR